MVFVTAVRANPRGDLADSACPQRLPGGAREISMLLYQRPAEHVLPCLSFTFVVHSSGCVS
jgi:hypothetical protein